MIDTTTAGRHPLPEPTVRFAEQSGSALVRHSLIHCKRLLVNWLRDPATLVQALLYPALTLLMLRIVLGDSVTAATGQPSIYGTVPMVALVGAMSGAIVSGLGLRAEAKSGLLSRFQTMPLHRASGLVGRVLAEMVRIVVTTSLILIVGILLGFRFYNGVLAGIALICIPVVFGIGFAVMVTGLATLPPLIPVVEIVGVLTTLLLFFNSGFVPVVAYPTWLQDVVANQPMSCAIDTMRGLAYEGPVGVPLLKTLAWSLGLLLVSIGPTVRGYRRAAQSNG